MPWNRWVGPGDGTVRGVVVGNPLWVVLYLVMPLSPCLAETAATLPVEGEPTLSVAANATLFPLERSTAGLIVKTEKARFDWSAATAESFRFVALQHSVRLTQPKTFHELSGPFWGDYVKSVKGLKGWDDGDSAFTNYVGHPMEGAVAGFIQVQNDPRGRAVDITDGTAYWKSRLKAMGWSALYSTQFELGPFSEASIGNVGARPGTMGYVDLVVTPTAGLGMIVAEDVLDHFVVARLERRASPAIMRVLRMVLSPNRSFANAIRFKKPWRRDNRDYPPSVAAHRKAPSAIPDTETNQTAASPSN